MKHKHTWQLYEHIPQQFIELGLRGTMVLPEVFKFVCEYNKTKKTKPENLENIDA